jgi:hypothetical protein
MTKIHMHDCCLMLIATEEIRFVVLRPHHMHHPDLTSITQTSHPSPRPHIHPSPPYSKDTRLTYKHTNRRTHLI